MYTHQKANTRVTIYLCELALLVIAVGVPANLLIWPLIIRNRVLAVAAESPIHEGRLFQIIESRRYPVSVYDDSNSGSLVVRRYFLEVPRESGSIRELGNADFIGTDRSALDQEYRADGKASCHLSPYDNKKVPFMNIHLRHVSIKTGQVAVVCGFERGSNGLLRWTLAIVLFGIVGTVAIVVACIAWKFVVSDLVHAYSGAEPQESRSICLLRIAHFVLKWSDSRMLIIYMLGHLLILVIFGYMAFVMS